LNLKQVGLISHFPIWEFINSPSPLVFLKIGDRQIDLIRAKRINGKYFHTRLGVFELDGEYENTMMGQPFYIHNLQNGKPISLRHIEKLQKLYRTNNTMELTEALSIISNNIENGMMATSSVDVENNINTKYTSPLDALKIIKQKMPKFLTDDDVKFIINYKYFEMADLMIFNFKKISEPKPDKDESKKIPTMIPMIIVSLIGIGAVLGLALGGIGHVVRSVSGDPKTNMLFGIKIISGIMGLFN